MNLCSSLFRRLSEVFIKCKKRVAWDLTWFQLHHKSSELFEVLTGQDRFLELVKDFRIGCYAIRFWLFGFFHNLFSLHDWQSLLNIDFFPFLQVCLWFKPYNFSCFVDLVYDKIWIAVFKRALDCHRLVISTVYISKKQAYSDISLAKGRNLRTRFDHFNN